MMDCIKNIMLGALAILGSTVVSLFALYLMFFPVTIPLTLLILILIFW